MNIPEHEIIDKIKFITQKENVDNISRTNAYFHYFSENRDIHWAFLASMVSRNAGWNMCDLEGSYFPHLLASEMRQRLFMTFERANWLIFQDAFPQLLLYHYSTKVHCPLFHLLKQFSVSAFMEREWNYFWHHRDYKRLLISLIVNEQHVIQKPVIEHHVYREKVFHSAVFLFQDWFHFSSVLFPTCNGVLYGASVHGFRNIIK